MKTKIVFASTNEGKINELKALVANLPLAIIPQSVLGVMEIPEVGLSFIENALLKARHAARATDLPAIADDSGLEVFALQGEPGIYSARYAGPGATSRENIEKLLSKLQGVPIEKRQACFQCVLVYIAHAEDPTPLICQGTWHGTILLASQGEHGFGYDPIFFVASENCSAAELPLLMKNRLSHRGQALQALLHRLPEKLLGYQHA